MWWCGGGKSPAHIQVEWEGALFLGRAGMHMSVPSYYAYEDTLLSWGDSFRVGGEGKWMCGRKRRRSKKGGRRESGVCVSWGTKQVGDSPIIQTVNDYFPQFSM